VATRKRPLQNVRLLLTQIQRAIEFKNVSFEDHSPSAWLPISETHVNKFIAERTLTWRTSDLLQPISTAIELLAEGKR
jgi:hypothetical protein